MAAVQATDFAGWARNDSYVTCCAEKDNINIPLFAQSVERFYVVAKHPLYWIEATDYPCPPDWRCCKEGDPPDVCESLYDDGITVIKVCRMPGWWRGRSMEVVVGGEVARGHYLQVYRKIKDADSWPQILVLYEDGNIRLKPQPPVHMPDTCFGSSIIIGPATPSKRPYVDVERVEIDPRDLSLKVSYIGGGTALIKIASIDRTKLSLVVNVDYPTDEKREKPFAIFRSMYVGERDGEFVADVEKIRSDSGMHDIMGDWKVLRGNWWFFYRLKKSTHNPSAPDIWVGLVPPEEGLSANICAEAKQIELPTNLERLFSATVKGFDAMVDTQTGFPRDKLEIPALQPLAFGSSLTEIGLRLLEILGKRDLGLIPESEAERQIGQVLSTLESVERVKLTKKLGEETITAEFFKSFYTPSKGKLVGGPGVGLLDNGNLAVALAIVSQAFSGDISGRCEAILEKMDFRFFLDTDGLSFRLGYYPEKGVYEPYSLGQWGSEGILAVIMAVAKDNVPAQALFRLFRASRPRQVTIFGETVRTVPGYAGGIWVRLFPLLFLASEELPDAFFDDAMQYVMAHILKARELGWEIWGWSPCTTTDGGYKEFGVPEVAQYGHPSLEEVTPYASFLVIGTLGCYPKASHLVDEAFENLEAISRLGCSYTDEFGFVDVIDPETGEVGPHIISLDKGIEAVSLINFLSIKREERCLGKYLWQYFRAVGRYGELRQIFLQIASDLQG